VSPRLLKAIRARASFRRTHLISLVASDEGIGSGHRCGSGAGV